ncbi:DDE-type integrase/transposase/recombinase [Phormidium tenue FACHB-886]|nr:DDE-type integrase/transposase/recombinase [Phormidium tenue FACHB-886]
MQERGVEVNHFPINRARVEVRARELRQSKYLNNIVEQAHRNIKRSVRPMMGFKSFNSTRKTLSGIEATNMICRGEVKEIKPENSVFQEKYIESIFEITA